MAARDLAREPLTQDVSQSHPVESAVPFADIVAVDVAPIYERPGSLDQNDPRLTGPGGAAQRMESTLALQRRHGNAFVQRLVASRPIVQRDDGGCDPSDRFEQEAATFSQSARRPASSSASVNETAGDGVQRQVADPAAPPSNSSAAGQTAGTLGAPVRAQSLEASATIAANTTISNDGGKWTHTTDAVQVRVSVSDTQLTITFSPQLVITADSGHWWVPNPDIYLMEAWFNFATGAYGDRMSAPNYALWGGAEQQTLTGVGDLFAKMPARMRAGGGYDPFTDPQLLPDLQAMASGFGGSGGGLPKLTNAEFTADVVLGGDLNRAFSGVTLSMKAGTRLSLSITPEGDVPTTAAEFANLKLSTVRAQVSGDGATVSLKAMDTEIPLIWVSSVTLSSGGKLHLEYVLATDALAAAWKVLMVGAGQAAPQELNEDPRNPAIHAAVDKAVSSHLEPLLREAILSNRAVIPGLDLATALGIAQ